MVSCSLILFPDPSHAFSHKKMPGRANRDEASSKEDCFFVPQLEAHPSQYHSAQ